MAEGRLTALHRRSIDDPAGLWGGIAEYIYWDRTWDKVLDASKPPFYRWFTAGVLNTCFNALDYHVRNGRGTQLALVYDSPVTNTIERFTYLELLDAVARFAGSLR